MRLGESHHRFACGGFVLGVLLIAPGSGTPAQEVFINEIHYDNTGADAGEAVELAGPAGLLLDTYELIFYNGSNGNEYGSMRLTGSIPNESESGFGTRSFSFAGIQNGAPDGLVLYHVPSRTVVQFLSYEGVMTARGGAAAGEESEDIGVRETASTAAGSSLQLAGTGSTYADFAWRPSMTANFGSINAEQTFEGQPNPTGILLALRPSRLVESSGNSATVTVSVSPPPPGSVTLSVGVEGAGREVITVPATIALSMVGTATFEVTVEDNLVDEGDREVVLRVFDPAGALAGGTAALTVVDDDRLPLKGEAVRVATYNLLNGTGDRGGSGYHAVAASISRIEPDVIAFQEVNSHDAFGALRSLLADSAFSTDDEYFATTSDAFRGRPYHGGDFNSGEQSLAIASRYPVKRVVQIGRDVPDNRREVTRFPLYAEIDIPWADDDDDLHVICVHYKAGTRDADRFRKAVEAHRTLEFLKNEAISPATHNVVILGDFNENTGNLQPPSIDTGRETFADGSSFPNGFQLGDDLAGANAVTIPYDSFPGTLFGSHGYKVLTARHANRSAINTLIGAEGVRLDYIVASDRLYGNGNRFTEVYNSELDGAFDGIPKQGDPAPASASRTASDHLPLFGDYWVKPTRRLTVSFSTAGAAVDEATTDSVIASIVLTPAPPAGERVAVFLSGAENDDLDLPERVTVTGPENSAAFEVKAGRDGRPDRDRVVALIARAEGHATGYGQIFVRNANASGRLLISQYVQRVNATLELTNASGAPLDFSRTPAVIRVFSDGAATSQGTVTLNSGLLQPGEAILAEIPRGIDGNDAIEVAIGNVRSDVFGRIGENPGVAWTAGGVRTSNANIALKETIATGSSGWSDPSLRFQAVSDGGDLGGLGIPPALADPYLEWIAGFGLAFTGHGHPDADPDGDSLANAGEFAFATDPLTTDRHAAADIDPDGVPVMLRRLRDGRVLYFLESTGTFGNWEVTPYFVDGIVRLNDGRERVRARHLSRILFRERSFRFQAVLP